MQGELDNVKCTVMGMKESDYVMMIMSTYGTIEQVGEMKHRTLADNTRISFKYPELVFNHYKYRHCVDDNNNRRQSPISIEKTWHTQYWPHRVFAFLLAVTEVNVNLILMNIYDTEATEQLVFRKILAKELINNDYLSGSSDNVVRTRSRRREIVHQLQNLPKNKKIKNGRVVESKMAYPQRKCHYCPRKIRTYCRCNPSIAVCDRCIAIHINEVENDY